jgi:hypothetical protein
MRRCTFAGGRSVACRGLLLWVGESRDRHRGGKLGKGEDRLEGVRAVCEDLMMTLCSISSQFYFCFLFCFLKVEADVREQLEGSNAQMSYFLRMRRRGGDDLPQE